MSPGTPLASLKSQRFSVQLGWTLGLEAMLSLLTSQGRCLDLGFGRGEGDLAFCWVGFASSKTAQILQHIVSKLLSELRGHPDLTYPLQPCPRL